MNRILATAVMVMIYGVALPAAAESITYLHHFSSDADHGLGPQGGVAISVGKIFGTTGSNSSGGTVFSMNIDGSDYQMLHEFAIDTTLELSPEGTSPVGKPIVMGSSIYGVNSSGFAPNNAGAIWAIDTDGTNFRVLHSFASGAEGGTPAEGLASIGNRLYGTTPFGGSGTHSGVLYSLNPDGSDYRVLHDFTGGASGSHPVAAPIQIGAKLYGTAGGGGMYDGGIVYSTNPDGSDFQIVQSFPYGFTPTAGVVAVGDLLFGATTGGGSGGGVAGLGTVYTVKTDGSDFRLLHEFLGGNDGLQPSNDLTTDGSRLFGTTLFGVAYALDLDGANYEILHAFHSGDDDFEPASPNALILSDGTLFGTTAYGGMFRGGTVFSIAVPEPPTLLLGIAGWLALCSVVSFRSSRRK